MTNTRPTDLPTTSFNGLLQQLNQTGKNFPAPLHEQLLAAGSPIVPTLMELVETDLHNPEPDPDYYGSIHAVQLLGELKDARAIPVLLDCLEEIDELTLLRDTALQAMIQLGEVVLEPCVERYWAAESGRLRNGVAEILQNIGSKDERIYEILIDTLHREPTLGAIYLAEYGDARALPLLIAKFDELPIDDGKDNPMANHVFGELAAAIKDLGGQLNNAQRKKLDESDKPRQRFAAELDSYLDRFSAATPKEPLKKTTKPGRNDPCWCGSGKKYKKCHLPLER